MVFIVLLSENIVTYERSGGIIIDIIDVDSHLVVFHVFENSFDISLSFRDGFDAFNDVRDQKEVSSNIIHRAIHVKNLRPVPMHKTISTNIRYVKSLRYIRYRDSQIF